MGREYDDVDVTELQDDVRDLEKDLKHEQENGRTLAHQLKLAQYEAATIRRAYLHARSLLSTVVTQAERAMSDPSAVNCHSLASDARIGRKYLDGSKAKLRRLLAAEGREKRRKA